METRGIHHPLDDAVEEQVIKQNVNNIFGISSKSLLTIIGVDNAWVNNIFICVLLMRNPTVSTPSNQFL